MEIRASDDVAVAEDLTPAIPPIAAALHDRFLRSHCSSCFRPLPNPQTTPPLSCAACDFSISYCSALCAASDTDRHASSGECLLFRSTWRPGCGTADVRAALRLLFALETLGFGSGSDSPGRIGGLLVGEGGEEELSERVTEGGALISRARGRDRSLIDERALSAALTNAVEVQVSGEGCPVGVAVYGPRFSWFNHSCVPNACYRFELSSFDRSERAASCDFGRPRVVPAGNGAGTEVWKTWISHESKLTTGMCKYGPRIVIRSIKPIKKDDEVCITYIDLLQPKEMRHSDLWSKYRFVCCCERCDASPQFCIDHILTCDVRSLDSSHKHNMDADFQDLSDFLDETITEFMSDGAPEACCKKLEKMLSEIFREAQFQAEEPSKISFMLHPLHTLSFNAYITLASAYRILSCNLLATCSNDDTFEAFRMRRAAAAYSLLLAGATNHLFMSETSLIATAAVFWTSAGESVLPLALGSNEPLSGLVSDHSWCTIREGSSMSWNECEATARRFLSCISNVLTRSWPFLVEGLPYLENIKSPVDFSWLGLTDIHQIRSGESSAADSCEEHSEYDKRAVIEIDEEKRGFSQLAVYCLTYGGYLATICYGPQCYLADNIKKLLHGIM